jgi:hypothetical protein
MIDDWKTIYTRGPCKGCGEKFSDRECIRGFCLPCRTPEDRRELVKFGVPRGSADALMLIANKCNGQAEFVLGKCHPRLMQNIVIVNGILKVRDKSYHWMRRGDWVKVQKEN